MFYFLTRQVLGSKTEIQLSEYEYAYIKSAKAGLLGALHIEEKFDLLLSNYIEIENELLRLSNENMLYYPGGWSELHDQRRIVSRRMNNLLSSCRLYKDQLLHLSSLLKGAEFKKNVKLWTNEAYDKSQSYRIMESLRNFVQHRGEPIHSLSCSSKWVSGPTGRKLFTTVVPILKPGKLKEEGDFKSEVLKEVAERDSIDLKPIIREYVGHLSAIHKKIRDTLRCDVQMWENELYARIEQFEKEFPQERIVGLAAVSMKERGRPIEWIPIFKDFMEDRQRFENRSKNLENLSSWCVTSDNIQ